METFFEWFNPNRAWLLPLLLLCAAGLVGIAFSNIYKGIKGDKDHESIR